MNMVATIRITGHRAQEIARTATYALRNATGWTEVANIGACGDTHDCGHGCKIHARKQGAITRYVVQHSAVYGCPLGRVAETREVRVSVAPKAV